MSRIHLKSHSVALWLSMAVAAAGAVNVGCSSSSDSDTGAAGAGDSTNGGAGKAGSGDSGDSGGETSTTSEAGAAGTVTQVPSGGTANMPSEGSDAGAGGTAPDTAGGTAEAGAGGSPPVVVDPTAAAVARAKKMIAGLAMPCTACHQPNYAGAGHWPNITPDEDTGIGGWSDDDIKKAITQGIGIDGHVFCGDMVRFKFTDSELSDVVTFLHSLKPVSKTISTPCK